MTEVTQVAEVQRLSRLLFEARENVEMFADIVESQYGRREVAQRRLVAEIDAYRAEQGWSPHGFGGEDLGLASCGICKNSGMFIHINDQCAEHGDDSDF